jgi:hypothetical protein
MLNSFSALILLTINLARMVAYDKDAVLMSAVGGAVLGASTAALMGLTGMLFRANARLYYIAAIPVHSLSVHTQKLAGVRICMYAEKTSSFVCCKTQ